MDHFPHHKMSKFKLLFIARRKSVIIYIWLHECIISYQPQWVLHSRHNDWNHLNISSVWESFELMPHCDVCAQSFVRWIITAFQVQFQRAINTFTVHSSQTDLIISYKATFFFSMKVFQPIAHFTRQSLITSELNGHYLTHCWNS